MLRVGGGTSQPVAAFSLCRPLLVWDLIKGFGASPDLVAYALDSYPRRSDGFNGADLYGGGKAAGGQGLQGAEREVGVPGTGQPWAKLLPDLWRRDKQWEFVERMRAHR